MFNLLCFLINLLNIYIYIIDEQLHLQVSLDECNQEKGMDSQMVINETNWTIDVSDVRIENFFTLKFSYNELLYVILVINH